MATNTSVAVAATSTLLRPALTGRQDLHLTNKGPAQVSISVGEAAVVGSGIILEAGQSYWMGTNETFEAYYAISASGTSNVAVAER